MLNINTITTDKLTLSDGTPVTFEKITSRGRVQVRVPTDHAELGDDPLRIFRLDGTHYKDATDLTLVQTPASAPAAVAASNDNTTYVVEGQQFSSLADAKAEAIDLFRETGVTIEILAVTTEVVGQVGFVAAA